MNAFQDHQPIEPKCQSDLAPQPIISLQIQLAARDRTIERLKELVMKAFDAGADCILSEWSDQAMAEREHADMLIERVKIEEQRDSILGPHAPIAPAAAPQR